MLSSIEQPNCVYKSRGIEILMAKFSNLAYKNIRKFKDNSTIFQENHLKDWKFVKLSNIPREISDKAFLAVNHRSKELVMVFKGSEPLLSFDLENIVNDWWIADLNLVVGVIPKQFYTALKFLECAKEYINQDNLLDDYKIFMTGHSLGGSIAQLLAAINENSCIETYTYNAYGVKHLLEKLCNGDFEISKNFNHIKNFSISADLVSCQNEHIGDVYLVKYEKNLINTIISIISELPKVFVDIPGKIIRSTKYSLSRIKWAFIKVNGHLMNNYTSGFRYIKLNEED